MSVIDGDDFDTYGGAFINASNVIDSETDMDAGQNNAATAATSGMSTTRNAAWLRMTMGGGAAPTLVDWRAVWREATPTAPVLAYSGTTGLFTVTWPTQVSDPIPLGFPGYTGPQGLLLRGGLANARIASGGTLVHVCVSISAINPNVADIVFFSASGAQVNPTGIDVDIVFL